MPLIYSDLRLKMQSMGLLPLLRVVYRQRGWDKEPNSLPVAPVLGRIYLLPKQHYLTFYDRAENGATYRHRRLISNY
jgi:NADH:ubiquinone oxidoreductase subunit E